MEELAIVKIIKGEYTGCIGEIHDSKRKEEDNSVTNLYVVFNNGKGEWFLNEDIVKATKDEEIQFLRKELTELYKEMNEIEAAYACLEFDFKLLLKTITNPNEQTIRIALKRGYDLNPKTKTRKIFPPVGIS
ncbi:hypothetical protein U8V72_23045 [Priestia filamentosa]|uniref:hypothetical protein n=1 Tax=Priestia filamentosa TaxID=1402861 RepID=UPI00397A950A